MRRSAFSLIELIFVIIILGILATVALPRFSSLQDDALISKEKAGIDALRSSIALLHGKMIIKGGDVNITALVGSGYSTQQGTEVHIEIEDSGTKFPKGLSIDFSTNDDNTTITTESANSGGTLAALIEPQTRTEWKTSALNNNIIEIVGPASSTITDSSSDISTNDCWEYNNQTGAITFRKGDSYSSDGS